MELRNCSVKHFIQTMSDELLIKACIIYPDGRPVPRTSDLDDATSLAQLKNRLLTKKMKRVSTIEKAVEDEYHLNELLVNLKPKHSKASSASSSATKVVIKSEENVVSEGSQQAGGELAPLTCVKAKIPDAELFGSPNEVSSDCEESLGFALEEITKQNEIPDSCSLVTSCSNDPKENVSGSSSVEDMPGECSSGCRVLSTTLEAFPTSADEHLCVAMNSVEIWDNQKIDSECKGKIFESQSKKPSSLRSSEVMGPLQLADAQQAGHVHVAQQVAAGQQRVTLRDYEHSQEQVERNLQQQNAPYPFVRINIPGYLLPLLGWFIFTIQWLNGRFTVHGVFELIGDWENNQNPYYADDEACLDEFRVHHQTLREIMPSKFGKAHDKSFWVKEYYSHGRPMGLRAIEYFDIIVYLYRRLQPYLEELARKLRRSSDKSGEVLQNEMQAIFGFHPKIAGKLASRTRSYKVLHELKFRINPYLFFRSAISLFGQGVDEETLFIFSDA